MGGRFRYSRLEFLEIRHSWLVKKRSVEEIGACFSDGAMRRWDARLRPDGTIDLSADEESLAASSAMSTAPTYRSANSATPELRGGLTSQTRREIGGISRRSPSPLMMQEMQHFEGGRDLVPVDSSWLKSHPLLGKLKRYDSAPMKAIG